MGPVIGELPVLVTLTSWTNCCVARLYKNAPGVNLTCAVMFAAQRTNPPMNCIYCA